MIVNTDRRLIVRQFNLEMMPRGIVHKIPRHKERQFTTMAEAERQMAFSLAIKITLDREIFLLSSFQLERYLPIDGHHSVAIDVNRRRY